jgi:hypothetical protein
MDRVARSITRTRIVAGNRAPVQSASRGSGCVFPMQPSTPGQRLDAFALPRLLRRDDRPHCPCKETDVQHLKHQATNGRSAERLLDVLELLPRHTRPVPAMTIGRERG